MQSSVLAADLGGTNLRMAVVDESGAVIYRSRRKTPRAGSYSDIVSMIADTAQECRDAVRTTGDPDRLSLAIPSSVRPSDGRIIYSPALPSLNGSNLAAELSERLGVPVALENDANAAALGESWLGASKDAEMSICITLGTGVGGGIILNGDIYRGVDGTAAEIGHIGIEPEGRPCGCGSRGCLEQYASATAIRRIAEELMAQYPNSTLKNARNLNAHMIFEAGKKGDELALEVFRTMGYYLGIGLASLTNLLNPEVIVIGGGAAAGWEMFIGHVRKEIKDRAFREPAERVKLVRAELGDDAGILGAARLAFLAKT